MLVDKHVQPVMEDNHWCEGKGEEESGIQTGKIRSMQLTQMKLSMKLNNKHKRAYSMILCQAKAELKGRRPPPLLLLVLSSGGTGKTMVINAVSEGFKDMGIRTWLAKTALSGVAASLIGGRHCIGGQGSLCKTQT
jgi:hypothetical protein